ncbi:MAG: hypothetical protein NTX24_02430 [Candidatus Pacearchaeota archaeon]|nr:hypothetical protein [Candidatus Pacearchaeota archaeon]
MIAPHPEKDQHLLIDRKILIEEIRAATLSKKDRVIEIGAGTGILTAELIESAEKVLAFELDKQFKEDLEKLKTINKNLEIIYGNALNFNWKGYDKIVSNIPYTLSEPIILKAIKEDIPFLVLIVSESFKEVLMNKETKIGAICGLFYQIKPLLFVDKTCFSPSPSVDSWLIKLERKEVKEKDNETARISKILASFVLKKGKIKNALIFSLVEQGKTKNQAREILERLKIPEKVLEKPVEKITGRFLKNLKETLSKLL